MKMKQALGALAAMTLIATPVAAQAAAAERTATPVGDAENIQGGWFLPLLALTAVILGLLTLLGGDDELPTSP